jgi:hypothetical protein
MDAQVTVVAEDVQVAAKARRRTYTVDFQVYGTRPVQKHGTPGSRPLT